MGTGASCFSQHNAVKNHFKPTFPRLSSPHADIKPQYDVVVIGSGYGASIAASRCARAGQATCVLERGKEWLPGEFPETFKDASEQVQITFGGTNKKIGESSNLYEFFVTDDLSVVQGCGLGGGSLINANVGLDCDHKVFEDPSWPKDLRKDLVNLLTIDRDHVHKMLRPTPYPDHYPPLQKLDRMKESLKEFEIEDLDKMFYKTPLYVTFEDTPSNNVGVPQPKCTACGNCCGGCNVGAKNTLNLNYLPDAIAHGAQIFTEVEVMTILKSHNSSDWLVNYKRLVPGSFTIEEQTIRATYVILGAGSLGSTKILLRSKEKGLEVSDQLGKRFSTNGDVLGFCYNGDQKANNLGIETKDLKGSQLQNPPGPCITSVMDFRKEIGGNFKSHFVIEDGTPPSIISVPYTVGVTFAAKVLGIEKYPASDKLEKVFQEISGNGIDNTLAFLCMSHDDSGGFITFDKENNDIDITWDRVGFDKNFEVVNQALENLSRGLGGTFVKNPTWVDVLGKSVVSAHPLGGCPMGETGRTGVVNHAGQVFDGESDEVLDGLYVVDGAILPMAVGVNPTMTISCIAERCIRLLAEREGWHIDYDTFIPLDNLSIVKRKPGIRFTEAMVGSFTPAKKNGVETPFEFTVTVESDDVKRMLMKDPMHSAKMSGTAVCPALSEGPMTISQGHFQLLSQSTDHIDTKELIYKMVVTGNRGQTYSVSGIKYVKGDSFGEIGLEDTTVLHVTVYPGSKFSGKPVGKGKVYVTLPNFAKQLATIEITNTNSKAEKVKWTSRFVSSFAGNLLDVYSPVTTKKSRFDLDAPPRQKRPLKLKGRVPEVHKCVTQDKFELRLTRFEGGSKGPVVLFHGVGVSSGIFSLDTIETNLVEYLFENRYDVWLVDWRASSDLLWTVYQDYTLDDCAAYDHPAAIDKVLEITKQKTVQVVAHCAGSLTFFGSLLSGALEGKVRSLVSSQVAANPKPSNFNKLKAGLYIPGTLESLGVDGLTVDTDDYVSLTENLFNTFVKGVSRVFLPYDELCQNPVCHRITFIYGLLWEHENLNPLTHDSLHEFFGYVSSKVTDQLALTMTKRKLVSAKGKDYLPDSERSDRLNSKEYKKHIQRLNIPICFIAGEKNSCYIPDSTFTTYKLAKEAHPTQEYQWIQIPNYGHLDCIYGKTAVYDVYPHILKALDAYAEDDLHFDKTAVSKVAKAVSSLTPEKSETEGPATHKPLQASSLPAELEVVPEKEDELEYSLEELVYPAEANDVTQPEDVENAWKELDQITPLDSWQTWPSKSTRKGLVKRNPSYNPPEGTDIEKVVIREMPNPNHPKKNLIIAMSDLHLDSPWSENIKERLNDFMTKLASIAEVSLNTLVLLGDVLEMWLYPLSLSPPTMEEHITKWTSNETCSLFFNVIRKMAEEDDVNIFYVRGNHDHELDANAVARLMGRKVEFIEGTLIYVINSDDGQQYRVRFAHGHDWDLFNTYSLIRPDDPLGGRPIGYYVSRAVATSEFHMKETEEVLRNVTTSILRMVDNGLGSFVAEILARPALQERLTETLIETALERDINEEEYVLLDGGKWVKMANLMKYKYIQRALETFGPTETYHMLKGALGNYFDFLCKCGEDVVVLGHTHLWEETRIKNRAGKLIYVNTGTWIDLAHEFSYARIVPPTRSNPGCVEVRRDMLENEGTV